MGHSKHSLIPVGYLAAGDPEFPFCCHSRVVPLPYFSFLIVISTSALSARSFASTVARCSFARSFAVDRARDLFVSVHTSHIFVEHSYTLIAHHGSLIAGSWLF